MITLKKWSGTVWVEDSPKVGVDTIVASGTPSSSTYLRGDGAWVTPPNTNNYPTSLSFNSTNGVLTLGRNGLTDLTVDLDGKYAEKTNSNYYVEGNSGGTAGTWTGTISDITALYTGLSIDYKINTAGASTTTLNINSYGAKTVRRNTSNLTTHLPVGTVVHLVYDGTYWVWADYDQGADHNVMFINNVIFGEATQGYHLLMEGINGKMYPVTSGGNAASTTNTITSAELKVGGSMIYYGSSTDYVANAIGGAYSLFTATYSGEMEYWSNKSTGWATAGLPFYIVGSINANGNLVLDGAGTTGNAFITQTLPTSDDGKVYIQVGFMRNTYDEWTLVSEHPMYIYKNGQLRLYGGEYIDYAADSDKLDGKHASEFATSAHTHDDRYYTESEVNTLLGGKSDTGHTHDDRYYTESEINTQMSGKASSTHGHGGISNDGKLGTQTAMGNGDALLLADSSNTNTIIRSDITLNTADTGTFLRHDGAWASPNILGNTLSSYVNTGSGLVEIVSDGDDIVMYGTGLFFNDLPVQTAPTLPIAKRMTANQSQTGTTLIDVTGMSYALSGGKTYKIDIVGQFASNTTTAGLKLYGAFSGSATGVGQSITTINGGSSLSTAEHYNILGVNQNWILSTGVTTANASNTFTISAVVNVTNSGTFKLQFAAEAGSAAVLTLYTGTTMVITELSIV